MFDPRFAVKTSVMNIVLFTSVLFAFVFPSVSAIGCFVCSSINGSEPDCEDTFNNTNKFYRNECLAGRRDRRGLFPATSCIKMKAYNSTYDLTVRDCTVDSGDTTSDTEMGRESHCWMVNMVRFNDVDMHGCALACNTDGCNRGSSTLNTEQVVASLVTVAMATVTLILLPSVLL